jgi:hypothetical protein
MSRFIEGDPLQFLLSTFHFLNAMLPAAIIGSPTSEDVGHPADHRLPHV